MTGLTFGEKWETYVVSNLYKAGEELLMKSIISQTDTVGIVLNITPEEVLVAIDRDKVEIADLPILLWRERS